jgi:arginase family enzyme
MHVRVLDLDGGIVRQNRLIDQHRPAEHELRWWGPRIRLGCSFGRFRLFERALAASLAGEAAAGPALTFYGSGDFHHVSLALLRRLPGPCNLLVLDNHPDWMRGVPFLHCGTWLYHAARLPQVRNIFHVGGNVDFDNGFRRLAPWPLLRSGKVTVFPAVRYFQGGSWQYVPHEPVRPKTNAHVTTRRVDGLVYTFREALKSYPLYVSLDKDVMTADEAPVNWDSGHLHLTEVEEILRCFTDAARGELAGMDIVGDWSPVRMQGLFRRFLHWTEHPRLTIEPATATRSNERTNMSLLKALTRMQAGVPEVQPLAA